MNRVARWSIAAVLVLAFASGAHTLAAPPPVADEDVIRRIVEDRGVDADWIASVARGQLTPAIVAAAVGRVAADAGALEVVARQGDGWRLRFENGTSSMFLLRDEDGLITGLFITELVPEDTSVEQPLAALAELPGETALIVTAGDQVLAAHNADKPLLVASAFKLAVLLAVRRSVDAGTLAWDQVVRYDAADASAGSGQLRGYPDGHPITVASLAAMMISLSDNTATDVLIDLVGRREVEAAGGPAPLTTTGEYFKLKADADLQQRYLDATPEERTAILEGLSDAPLPGVGDYANGRTAHGWRLSVSTLCELMTAVADLDLMTINPGAAIREDWARIAFKGGNDFGITNLTYMLRPLDGGPPFCISMTWNEADHYDDAGFALIATRIFNVLREIY